MKMKRKLGVAAIAMMSAMTLTFAPMSGAAANKEQIPAWASTEIAKWTELGLLKGNQQGNLLPNESVTKAEFVTFINRVFNFTAQTDLAFPDVPASAWYAPEMSKAVAAGILIGEGNGKLAPLEKVTREKAALILYRVFQVKALDDSMPSFKDDADISSWAKEAIYTMKSNKYVEGDNGAFQPKRALTRAEAVKMINNVMGKLIADGGSYTDIDGGNIVVNTDGGVLSNINLRGHMYITSGVGEGDLTIESSQIGGTIYVNGGGANTITLKDSTADKIIINKPSSTVRVLLSGTSKVTSVYVLSNGKVDNATTNGIPSLTIAAGPTAVVGVTGPVTQLNFNSNSSLQVGASHINKLMVSEGASGGNMTLAPGAKVDEWTANGGVSVTGEGTIEHAIINAANVSLSTSPNKLTLNANEVTIGGKVVKKDTAAPPVTGNPGTNPPAETPTKLYTYAEALSGLGSNGAEQLTKQYIMFLQDPTYKPSVANPNVSMPELTNAITFVNYEYTVKPSIFPSLRAINTSVLDDSRKTLWIGTDSGATKINLTDNAMKSYTKENNQLLDNRVLLLISDGNKGVFAITETGVSHIYQ